MRTSRSWTSLAALALLFCLPAEARRPRRLSAEDNFQRHYDEALRLYEDKWYERAITKFLAAYKLNPLPRLLQSLGQAHRKLGHAREAIDYFDLYLRTEPDLTPELHARIEGYLAELRTPPAAPAPLPPAGPTTPSGPAALPARRPAPALTPAPPVVTRTFAPSAAPESPKAAPLRLEPVAVARILVPPPERPLYKRWWLWTTVGLVAAGAVAGIVVATLPRDSQPMPLPDHGELHFSQK